MADHPVKTRPARQAPPQVSRFTAPVFAELTRRTQYADPALIARWREIAGEEVAKLCRPGRIGGGRQGATFEVIAADAPAAARLQFEAEGLRRRLNDYLGPSRIGRVIVKVRAAPGGPDSALSAALSRFRQSFAARRKDQA